MTYALAAIVSGTTYSLTDSNPFSLVAITGIGIPALHRLTERGPFQHGATDLGFRLDPRLISIIVHVNATSLSNADANRATLMTAFNPLPSTPILLKITRDDGAIRQIDCHAAGAVDIPNTPTQDRMGASQRVVIQLQAADPVWYDPTPVEVDFVDAGDWWLGLGTITAGQVAEHVTTPTQGQAYAGAAVADSSPWSIFFQTNITTLLASPAECLFQTLVDSDNTWSIQSDLPGVSEFTIKDAGAEVHITSGWFATGLANYFVVSDGTTVTVYRENVSKGAVTSSQGFYATGAKWRSRTTGAGTWTPTVPYGAIYNIALDSTKRAAILGEMAGGLVETSSITYTGTAIEYPVITVTGPIADCVITNTTTGEVLDFTGVTIAAANVYTIDLRYGYKTVVNQAGVNKIADLTAASDLAIWHLEIAPIASGGVNAIGVAGTATTAATEVAITYYKRYVSS
jgi:hypothetical protein